MSLVLRIEIGERFQQGSVKRNSQKLLRTRSYASENTIQLYKPVEIVAEREKMVIFTILRCHHNRMIWFSPAPWSNCCVLK